MSNAAVRERVAEQTEECLAAELEAYNRAFLELELSWRWDAPTFRDLLRNAADRDFVGVVRFLRHAQGFTHEVFIASRFEHCLRL